MAGPCPGTIRMRSPVCCDWGTTKPMPRHRPVVLRLTLLLCLLLVASALQAQGFPPSLNQRPAAPPQVDGQLSFCVFGDCQPAGNYANYRVTTAIMQTMALERPQFVIGLGDYIDGARGLDATRKQWQRFFGAVSPLQKLGAIPMVLTIGNHDSGSPLFDQYFGRRYFSFDAGNAHFIVLDTQQPGQYGRIAGTQWEWLNQDLAAAANARLIFVTVHQPLFPVGVHRGSAQDKYPPYRDRLHTLLAKYKVSAVFSGHEHLYNHQERNGVHYFISGGGGAPLYANADKGGFHHYLRVECADDSFTVQVKRLSL